MSVVHTTLVTQQQFFGELLVVWYVGISLPLVIKQYQLTQNYYLCMSRFLSQWTSISKIVSA